MEKIIGLSNEELERNEKYLKAVRKLVDYMKQDEERHFEESAKPKNHIYRSVMKVERWLNAQEYC